MIFTVEEGLLALTLGAIYLSANKPTLGFRFYMQPHVNTDQTSAGKHWHLLH